jgi:hypothetical protein
MDQVLTRLLTERGKHIECRRRPWRRSARPASEDACKRVGVSYRGERPPSYLLNWGSASNVVDDLCELCTTRGRVTASSI